MGSGHREQPCVTPADLAERVLRLCEREAWLGVPSKGRPDLVVLEALAAEFQAIAAEAEARALCKRKCPRCGGGYVGDGEVAVLDAYVKRREAEAEARGREEEREACARVADDIKHLRDGYAEHGQPSYRHVERAMADTAKTIAERIRGRRTERATAEDSGGAKR